MRATIRQILWLIVALILNSTTLAESTRVATYNLHNYLVMDRHVSGVWRPAYPKPEGEKAILRQVIVATNPDVLALQELGGAPFLQELRADLALDGVDYPYAIHMCGADGARHLGVLSKLPPIEVVKHQDLNFNYLSHRESVRRGMLEVSFLRSHGALWKLFVVHLKSRWSDEPADPKCQLRRTLEAEACRNRIIERTIAVGVTDYLIAGDFNDHPASAPMRRFYRRGGLVLGALLPVWDSRQEQWTCFYPKQSLYSRVDGFVISTGLSAAVEAGHGSIVDIPDALLGSDHRMVYVDLSLSLTQKATVLPKSAALK